MAKEIIVGITDSGARGAAVAEAYAKNPDVKKFDGFPGKEVWDLNTFGKLVVPFPELKTTSKKDILQICQDYGVTLLDVCQDGAVFSGLVDDARELGILTVGPTKAAGAIEWNKIYARKLGERKGIPQPPFTVWESASEALGCLDYVLPILNNKSGEERCWVKAAGLAEGKGAIGAKNKEEAEAAIKKMSEFGKAGKRFLIEEWLRNDDGTAGEEFSYFVLCNGEEFVYLGSAQDNKTIGNRDEGPNTGGMGGHTEPEILDDNLRSKIEKDVIGPILQGLTEDKRPYTGILYFSGMKVTRGGTPIPMAIEFNARWGDPEAQLILPGIKNDWFELMMDVAQGKSISNIKIENDGLKRVGVVVASLGYPGDYSKVNKKQIFGIEEAMEMKGVNVYGAGVDYDGKTFKADGGRLLTVVGAGKNIIEAREKAYGAVSYIIVGDNQQVFRTDIAARDVKRFHQSRS